MRRPNFRYYRIDPDGVLHDAVTFDASDDQQAIEAVAAKHPDARCEIWAGSRLVATLPVRVSA